ncbi:MAG: ABC transporter permease [Candidatus Acidiferrales bacterium]
MRYGLRMLRKSPGFTAVAVLTLALGIGANTAIFSVVNAVLVAPLAYPHADRLVQLQNAFPEGSSPVASIPNFNVWRQQTQVFDAVAAYNFSGPGINLTGNGLPEQLKGIHASSGYFSVFSVPMALGRAYTAQEDFPNGPNVVVISNSLWRGRFGGDPNMIGRAIELGGDAYTIVGVTGATFHSDPQSDLWLPLRADPNSTDRGHYLLSSALLKPGITMAQARAAMKIAAAQFRRRFPDFGAQNSFTAVPLKDALIGNVRKGLLLLLGAVGFVLLIACANVANLLLARATLRKREIALRAALGAGRRRIVEQLLTESVLLSLVGGALGLAIGYVGVKALLAANPVGLPRIGEYGAAVTLDWRVLGFTLLVAIVTGILFGLIPALNASRADLSAALKESGMRSGGGMKQNKARSILVVTEMALALILLVGAALLIRTFAALRDVNPGFDAHSILTMDMSLAGGRFAKASAVELLERNARQQVETVPGVETAALTCCLPYEGGYGLPFNIVGQSPKNGATGADTADAAWMIVTPEYFKVFRIPVISGRAFNDQDGGAAGRVVIINEAMVKQYWPKHNALGSQIVIGKGVGPEWEEGPRQVVGIVGDIRQGGLDQPAFPTMYVPFAQVNDAALTLIDRVAPVIWVVRTRMQPFSISKQIQDQMSDASGGLPVGNVRSMEQVTGDSLAQSDFNTTLLTIFAGVALLLAAIGIYGLMAYSVQQRTLEIGIRMALGASPERVRGMVVRQGMLLAGIGVGIGVGAALGLTRLMSGMIYGVKTWDPATFIAVVLVLSGVSLLATYVPARRASRVDPMVALKYE